MFKDEHTICVRSGNGGDGIVVKGVENTIRAVSSIARDGMRETDNEIIRLMIGEETVK